MILFYPKETNPDYEKRFWERSPPVAEEIKFLPHRGIFTNVPDDTMTDQMIQITLPKRLVDRLSELITETEFDSVDQYVAYVLEELVNESSPDEGPAEVSEGEEEEIKKRLIALGYFE